MANADEQVKESSQRTRIGVVSSARGDKTIRVVIEELRKHATYGKYQRRHTKLAAHDEGNVAMVGDTVEISSCRPISRTKSWRLLRVIKKANVVETTAADRG